MDKDTLINKSNRKLGISILNCFSFPVEVELSYQKIVGQDKLENRTVSEGNGRWY